MAYVASSPHPPTLWDVPEEQLLESHLYISHAQSIPGNIPRTIPPKSYSPVGRDARCGWIAIKLLQGCCHCCLTAAKLLLWVASRLHALRALDALGVLFMHMPESLSGHQSPYLLCEIFVGVVSGVLLGVETRGSQAKTHPICAWLMWPWCVAGSLLVFPAKEFCCPKKVDVIKERPSLYENNGHMGASIAMGIPPKRWMVFKRTSQSKMDDF